MRAFNNCREAYNEIKRDLKEMGIRYTSASVQDKVGEFETVELYGYAFKILEPEDAYELIQELDLNTIWAQEEWANRIHGRLHEWNPGWAYRYNEDFWEQFLRDGRFSYTYAERIQPQLQDIIHELTERPNTRQAVITVYDWHQDIRNFGGRDRIPCSMHYQFLRREDKLHCIYAMRSCDFVKFLPYDLFFTTELVDHIAGELGIDRGYLTYLSGSLHAFEKDLKGVF
jgi:thymidylate synthase